MLNVSVAPIKQVPVQTSHLDTLFRLQQLTIQSCFNLIYWAELWNFSTSLPDWQSSYLLLYSWTRLINRITCQSYRTETKKKTILWYLAFTAGRDHALYRSLFIIYPERANIFHPTSSPLKNGKTRMRFIIWWSAYGRYADSRSQPRWRGASAVDRQRKFLARYFFPVCPCREAGTQPGGRKHMKLRDWECTLAHCRARAHLLIEAIFYFFPAHPSRWSCSTASARGNLCLNGSWEKIGYIWTTGLKT